MLDVVQHVRGASHRVCVADSMHASKWCTKPAPKHAASQGPVGSSQQTSSCGCQALRQVCFSCLLQSRGIVMLQIFMKQS